MFGDPHDQVQFGAVRPRNDQTLHSGINPLESVPSGILRLEALGNELRSENRRLDRDVGSLTKKVRQVPEPELGSNKLAKSPTATCLHKTSIAGEYHVLQVEAAAAKVPPARWP